MQDTTSSAMTEVALGLSMAFFTLLIVALLSISVPKETIANEVVKSESQLPKELTKKKLIDIQMNNKQNVNGTMQFAFYFNQKFYDKSLTIRTIESFSKDNKLIIAVDPQLSFSEVFSLKQRIKHDKLSITTLNKAWHSRLQNIAKLD